MTRALARHDNNLHNNKYLNRPLYRSKEMRKDTLKDNKTNWFRKAGATTTLFIPTTYNSEFAKKIKADTKRYQPNWNKCKNS